MMYYGRLVSFVLLNILGQIARTEETVSYQAGRDETSGVFSLGTANIETYGDHPDRKRFAEFAQTASPVVYIWETSRTFFYAGPYHTSNYSAMPDYGNEICKDWVHNSDLVSADWGFVGTNQTKNDTWWSDPNAGTFRYNDHGTHSVIYWDCNTYDECSYLDCCDQYCQQIVSSLQTGFFASQVIFKIIVGFCCTGCCGCCIFAGIKLCGGGTKHQGVVLPQAPTAATGASPVQGMMQGQGFTPPPGATCATAPPGAEYPRQQPLATGYPTQQTAQPPPQPQYLPNQAPSYQAVYPTPAAYPQQPAE